MDAKHWLSLDEREEDAAAQQPVSETTPLTTEDKIRDSPSTPRTPETKVPPGTPADGRESPRTMSPASSIGPEGGKDIFYHSDEPRSRSNSKGISDKKQYTKPDGRGSVSPTSDASGQKKKPRKGDLNGDQTAMMVDSPKEARKDRMDYLKKIARRRMSSECHAMEEAEANPHKPKKPSKWPIFSKSKIDHSPHEMFVQLDELSFIEGGQMAWLEKARWVKFEEDLEEAAGRWGKPHVASLSFRSLVDLRKCIKKGAILLDLPHEDPADIGQSMVEQLIYIDQMEPEDKKSVLQSLMLRRRHVGQAQQSRRPRLQRSLTQTAASPAGGATGSLRDRFQSSLKRERKESETKKSLEDVAQKGQDGHKDHVHISIDDVKNMVDGQSIKSASPPTSPASDGKRPRPPLVHRASIDESFARAQETDIVKQPNPIMQRIVKNAEATICMVGKVDFLQKPICSFVRLSTGRKLGNLMEVDIPVRFVFLLMGPEDPTLDYFEIGRAAASLMSHPHFRNAAYMAENRQDILDAILDYLDESMVLPSGEWDKKTLLPIMNKMKKIKKTPTDEPDHPEPDDKIPSPLTRTGRPFGGLVNDIRRRYPKYLSDFKDALNMKCLAAVFFIYFTCLSPAITFGGLWAEKTNMWLGVSEMLVGLCVVGSTYALLAGQPILCVAATGPILVFEEALYQVTVMLDVDFISFRCWVGLWMSAIVMITVAVEGSVLVRFFTRFINDIFAILTAIILILETLKKLFKIFMKHPLQEYYPPPDHMTNMTCQEYMDTASSNSSLLNLTIEEIAEDGHHTPYGQPNTALLSVILCFGTFIIAWQLKGFKLSKYFTKRARTIIGDFAVPVAIVIMVMVDFFIDDTYTEKLAVPDGIAPTNSTKRGWIINPLGSSEKKLQVWAIFLAIVPAFLLFILVFMETLITSMIVNQKDRGMVKGSGYHLDLFLMGCFSTLCGICGFPFVCPATLRSMTHAAALTVWSQTHAPGESARVIEVKEQRVTGVCVHILLGVSVLLGPLLRQIPMTVLFGVFFYMGVAALHGVQLMDRFYLFFTPVKHWPDIGYCRKVRHVKMHLFTFIEVFFVLLMGAVKFTKASICFPFILMMMMPLRFKVLPLIFTPKELAHLDCEVEEHCSGDHDDDDDDKYLQPPKSPSSVTATQKEASMSPTVPAREGEKEPIMDASEPQNV